MGNRVDEFEISTWLLVLVFGSIVYLAEIMSESVGRDIRPR